MSRRTRRMAIASALLAAAFAAGCGRPQGPLNLVLITIDTLRPDRLGAGGNPRPTSPALDRLAAESATFARSYSQSGWTLPSISTILTGLHPSAHGAVEVGHRLKPEVATLAGLLSERGYDARAFVSHVFLSSDHGLDRGFASYDESVLAVGHPHKVATAEPLTDLVMTALDDAAAPFFLWLHYFDPHFDYLAHPEWKGYGSSKIDHYDGEIAHTDRQIGRLLERLSARGDDGRTVVAVTADHGEAFGEHGGRFHFSLYDEVLRTPLMIKAPGVRPGERPLVAQQIDLLPTLLSLLGVPAPEGLPGRDLLAASGPDPPVFIERRRPDLFRQRALVWGRYKLAVVEEQAVQRPADVVARQRRYARVRPGTFLFDLEADPGETRNLWNPEDPTAQRLLQRLEAYRAGVIDAAGEEPLSEEMTKKLRALGYIQ